MRIGFDGLLEIRTFLITLAAQPGHPPDSRSALLVLAGLARIGSGWQATRPSVARVGDACRWAAHSLRRRGLCHKEVISLGK